jgi:hypothetical protein
MSGVQIASLRPSAGYAFAGSSPAPTTIISKIAGFHKKAGYFGY